jgi:hypothetical protein
MYMSKVCVSSKNHAVHPLQTNPAPLQEVQGLDENVAKATLRAIQQTDNVAEAKEDQSSDDLSDGLGLENDQSMKAASGKAKKGGDSTPRSTERVGVLQELNESKLANHQQMVCCFILPTCAIACCTLATHDCPKSLGCFTNQCA